MAFRDKQKVIYTSPLKVCLQAKRESSRQRRPVVSPLSPQALSNQKYRELAEEFSDVGLMTGDVTISPNANCVVMASIPFSPCLCTRAFFVLTPSLAHRRPRF